MRAGDGAPRGPTLGPLQCNVFVRPRSGEPAPSGPPLGPLMRLVQPPVRAGDQAPREPTLGPLRHSAVVRLRPGDPTPSGPLLGPVRSRAPGAREADYGRPKDGGVWTAKAVKRPTQQPTHTQYANYRAPLMRKRHTMPHPAQPQHTNHWALRTRKQHQQEHQPQRPTESSNSTQHAEEQVTVQGPVSKQQPDGMSHRGAKIRRTSPVREMCLRSLLPCRPLRHHICCHQ